MDICHIIEWCEITNSTFKNVRALCNSKNNSQKSFQTLAQNNMARFFSIHWTFWKKKWIYQRPNCLKWSVGNKFEVCVEYCGFKSPIKREIPDQKGIPRSKDKSRWNPWSKDKSRWKRKSSSIFSVPLLKYDSLFLTPQQYHSKLFRQRFMILEWYNNLWASLSPELKYSDKLEVCVCHCNYYFCLVSIWQHAFDCCDKRGIFCILFCFICAPIVYIW